MVSLKYVFCGLSAACLISTTSSAQILPSPTTESRAAASEAESLRLALQTNLPAWLDEYDVPSAAIAYIENGKLAWTMASGEANKNTPATPETLYNIASMTKPLVAETVTRLAASGHFSLDDSMAQTWIDPDIQDDPRHIALTPTIALTHRTGFPNWRFETDNILTFKHDPDSQFGYSGEGLQYVARYIERKMGEPLETLVAENIFGPAGMTETTFTDKDWLDGRIAISQAKDGTRAYAPRREKWNAADDVWSSVSDYARFMIFVMDNPVNEQSPSEYWLPEHNLKSQICGEGRVSPELCPNALGFSAGWSIYDTSDNLIVFHGGGDVGERTMGLFNPITKQGAVIFTNGANGQKIVRDVIKTLLPDPSFGAFMTMQAGG